MWRQSAVVVLLAVFVSACIIEQAEAGRRCRLFHRRRCPPAYGSRDRQMFYLVTATVYCVNDTTPYNCSGSSSQNFDDARRLLCEEAAECCPNGFVISNLQYSTSTMAGAIYCDCHRVAAAPADRGRYFHLVRYIVEGDENTERYALGRGRLPLAAQTRAQWVAHRHHDPDFVIILGAEDKWYH